MANPKGTVPNKIYAASNQQDAARELKDRMPNKKDAIGEFEHRMPREKDAASRVKGGIRGF